MRRRLSLSALVACLTSALFASAADIPAAHPLDDAYAAMYNLDFARAQITLREYQKTSPADPRGPVSEAAGILFQELDRMGVLESRFFVNDRAFRSFKPARPDPQLRIQFDNALSRAESLARARVALEPRNCDALFAITLLSGLRADYASLVENRSLAALKYTKASAADGERLFAECHEYDAYVATGISRYLIGAAAAPIRWVLRLGGYSGDKQKGIAELKLAAEHGRYLAPFARILLSIAYIREKDNNSARALLDQLRRDFPHNPLFARELARLQTTPAGAAAP